MAANPGAREGLGALGRVKGRSSPTNPGGKTGPSGRENYSSGRGLASENRAKRQAAGTCLYPCPYPYSCPSAAREKEQTIRTRRTRTTRKCGDDSVNRSLDA